MGETRGAGRGFRRALDELKTRGSTILVTGHAPEGAIDAVSAQFLGRRPERSRIFALLDREVRAARRRLHRAEPGREPAIVLDAIEGTRSATAADGSSGDSLDVRYVECAPEPLADAIADAIADAERRHGPPEPAELRLCVDSLRHLEQTHGVEAVREFVAAVREVVLEVGGMAHFVFPGERTEPPVEDLFEDFDVVVELRRRSGVVEQRWLLPEYGIVSMWTEL